MFYCFQSAASQKQNRICFSVTEVKVKFNTSLLTSFICDSQLLHEPINLIRCFIVVCILSDGFGDKLFCSALRKFLLSVMNKFIGLLHGPCIYIPDAASYECQLCSRVFSFKKKMLSVQLLCSLFHQNV